MESINNSQQPIEGGCLCGAIRYEARGEPIYVPFCHCVSCRRATGAPVVVRVVFPSGQVVFTQGARKFYQSSAGVKRSFCADCGTPISWEGIWDDQSRIEIYIGTLDDPEAFVPDRHAFLEHAIGWFDVKDGLPRHRGSSTQIELG